MQKIKDIVAAIGRAITHPWFVASLVAIIVVLFALWYGAAWSLILALPLIYDYYIGHRIAKLHHRLMERYQWWRTTYAALSAAIFAAVVAALVQMLLFRWETPFFLTFVVLFVYAMYEELKLGSKLYNWIYGWVNPILFATVAATLIQCYWFQMFVIPTGSMESTLMAGDYILVSKPSYGPRVPMTPLSFPFVHNTMPRNDQMSSFSTLWQRDYLRLKGMQSVERGDVVVFNFPEGDTVVMERAAESYYQLLLSSEFGATERERRENIMRNYTIAVRPLDKKENYIKRCVGVAGDTLRIVNGTVYHGSVPESDIPNKQYYYDIYDNAKGRLITGVLLRDTELATYADTTRYTLRKSQGFAGERLIPHTVATGWTLDNFGPVWIPAAGASIELNDYNVAMYGRAITVYEGHTLDKRGDSYFIDGVEAKEYTFAQNYYFMMGDNRHGSLDSRFWGFVPQDHIVGKASYVWFSVDPYEGGIRWERMFKSIL